MKLRPLQMSFLTKTPCEHGVSTESMVRLIEKCGNLKKTFPRGTQDPNNFHRFGA